MSTARPSSDREDLERRIREHSFPWQFCRFIWVGIKLAWVIAWNLRTLLAIRRLSEDRKRARNDERLDRIRNPHRYRGRE
jgi:hypothetical protein